MINRIINTCAFGIVDDREKIIFNKSILLLLKEFYSVKIELRAINNENRHLHPKIC